MCRKFFHPVAPSQEGNTIFGKKDNTYIILTVSGRVKTWQLPLLPLQQITDVLNGNRDLLECLLQPGRECLL